MAVERYITHTCDLCGEETVYAKHQEGQRATNWARIGFRKIMVGGETEKKVVGGEKREIEAAQDACPACTQKIKSFINGLRTEKKTEVTEQ